MMKSLIFCLLTFSLSAIASAVSDPVKVFIDCRTNCDLAYYRQEINYVDHVRDQNLAEVHVLITSYPMASGGRKYELSFIGHEAFDGQASSLVYNAPPSVQSDERRRNIVQQLKLGLVAYLMQTDLAEDIQIKVKGNRERNKSAREQIEEDPWKHWVFETSVRGNMNIQQNRRTYSWRLDGEVSHVTDHWRIVQNTYFNNNTKIFIDDEETIHSKLQRYGVNGRVVKSIDDHWSAGFFESLNHSTFSNINMGVGIGPALEYSIFPYRDVTFREITIAYFNRFYYRDYLEETLFGKTGENLWDQSIRISARFRKPWGSLFSSLQGRHFFHDLSKNSLAFNNRVNLQVIKGLAFSVTTNFEFINDQLHLPKGDASLEEILLQQRSLSTDFEFYFAMGVSYTFGSIYNNIINTRL